MKGRIKELWNEPFLRFIVYFILLYLLLNYFNVFYIGITSKGGLYFPFLDENLNYIAWWRTFSIKSTAAILEQLGHQVIIYEYRLKVIGASSINLVYSCLGYGIMSVFAAFCLSFPSPFKHRFGFMLAGLCFIQMVNIGRFVLLSLFRYQNKMFFGIDHHDLYNILIYLLLTMICYLWIQHAASNNGQNSAQKKLRH